jgi:hypothetical protein
MNGNTKKKRCNTRKITRKYKRGRNASNRSNKNMSKTSFHLYNSVNKNDTSNIISQYGGNISIIEKIKDKYPTRKSWDEGVEKFSKIKENNITEENNISTNVEVFNDFLKSIFNLY